MVAEAGDGQCEVVLVGCGAPKRGMGWYHAEQLNKGKCPSAKLCFIVEPWFLGGGKTFLASVVRILSVVFVNFCVRIRPKFAILSSWLLVTLNRLSLFAEMRGAG